ncbi:Protein KTI12 homolog [Strongyloides ratti]|uniref:Protein KTI12 homolog n=1 Tax=Strongyloides ratti TaxID=34506 RepID=A0A090MYV8_STRRB|nr:Protein KTI12 homolog [Strongyloides ratti]CEF67859.1 Protein KTI12 homolog [Strongyloides ratti]
MPLLVVYGKPCSGKTKTVNDFIHYLTEKLSISDDKIKVICDTDNTEFSTNIYDNAKLEKEHRSLLKSLVDDNLKNDKLIILDALNYIKGYRYELHCIAKKVQTKFALLIINEDDNKCKDINKEMNMKYEEKILNEIIMRMEYPISKDFWDNPNVVINTATTLKESDNIDNFDQLYRLLFEGVSLVSNKSTRCQPIANKNFVTDIAKITKKIIITIDSEQKKHKFGDRIKLPYTDSDDKDDTKNSYLYIKQYSISELDRYRKIFLGTVRGQSIEGANMIGNLFVNYLNTHLSLCHIEGEI